MRKLLDNERAKLMEYVSIEPEMNLFIIGDVEHFGLESENVEVFVHEVQGQWDFILLRYMENFLIYSPSENYDAQAAAEFLHQQGAGLNIISGKSDLVSRLLPYFPGWHGQETFMARLNRVQFLPELPENTELRRMTADDATDIVSLNGQIEEFRDSVIGREKQAIEELRFKLMNQAGRNWGAFCDGELVSTVATAADNSISSMLVGVATLPFARKKGLASALVANLCAELLQEGKQFVCLFYDNPAAGSIYRKVGFQEVGGYTMMKRDH